MRLQNGSFQCGKMVFIKSKRFQPHQPRALVQKSNHHTLAIHRRNRGNSHVHLSCGYIHFHAAILRQTPLGDVHLSPQFQVGDGRHVHPAGRGFCIKQYAVNTIPHPEFLLRHLKMKVGGAVFHCPE